MFAIEATLIAQPVDVPALLKSLAVKLAGSPLVVTMASLKRKTKFKVPLERAAGVVMKDATGALRSTTIGPAVRSALGLTAGPELPAASVTELAVITGIRVPSLHDETSTENV